MLKEKDHKDNLLFVIGKDGLTMDRKRGSLNHDKYLYGKGEYSMKNIDMPKKAKRKGILDKNYEERVKEVQKKFKKWKI